MTAPVSFPVIAVPLTAGGGTTLVADGPLVASGLRQASRWLARRGIACLPLVADGAWVGEGDPLLAVDHGGTEGTVASALRRLRRSCALATATAHLVLAARRVRADAEVVILPRRRPPGPMASAAVRDGGAIPGPGPLRQAVRSDAFRPLGDPAGILRARALATLAHPVVLWACRPEDVDEAVGAVADLLLLDGFSLAQVRDIRNRTFGRVPALDMAVMGGFSPADAADHVAAGARMLICTSLPSATGEVVSRRHPPGK